MLRSNKLCGSEYMFIGQNYNPMFPTTIEENKVNCGAFSIAYYMHMSGRDRSGNITNNGPRGWDIVHYIYECVIFGDGFGAYAKLSSPMKIIQFFSNHGINSQFCANTLNVPPGISALLNTFQLRYQPIDISAHQGFSIIICYDINHNLHYMLTKRSYDGSYTVWDPNTGNPYYTPSITNNSLIYMGTQWMYAGAFICI